MKYVVANEQTRGGLQADQTNDQNAGLAPQGVVNGRRWVGADIFEIAKQTHGRNNKGDVA